MKKLLLHAWSILKRNDKYYLPYTHWVYLREIVKYYDEVVLLSPCQHLTDDDKTTSVSLSEFNNVRVYELPYSKGGYAGAMKYFFAYKKAYKSIKGVTTYYSRYPTPFGWLQKVYAKDARRIIHYVGDPLDAAKNNPNFSKWKKKLLALMFKPENAMYDWACKGADVFTNGHHIAERLEQKGIKATPLISSTLTDDDFYFEDKEPLQSKETIKFAYLGGLRTAKGIETVIKAFDKFNKNNQNSILNLIGAGEHQNELEKLVKKIGNRNINFLGRIDDRDRINTILRESDMFLFASLSEGSPRVILEAMANGLLVITTPVGSLPKIFRDGIELFYSDFNSPSSFYDSICKATNGSYNTELMRERAFTKVSSYTNENFLKQIFDEQD